jgi:UV DNA damage endonuclease
MPAKRKFSGVTMADAQVTKATPRRSSRRLNVTRDMTGADLGLTPDGFEGVEKKTVSPKRRQIEREGRIERYNIRHVMKELGEMERRLQNAVKRQRRAIETSNIIVKEDEVGQEAFKPKSLRSHANIDALDPRGFRQVPESPPDTEKCSLEADDHGHDAEDTAPETMNGGNEGTERGSARPPAVNSGYLPLPWNGRLGYVRLPVLLASTFNHRLFSH